jgi:diamine N-acetyltransferase
LAEHEPDLVVVGERVALGPIRKDLAATYARWVNSEGVRYGLGNIAIATPESEEKWVDEVVEKGAKKPPEVAEFTIYDRTDGAPVGTVGLFEIEHEHGSAEFGILLGERRGQGLGTEATRLVLAWAFETLGLRNVLLQVLAWNAEAQRAYERAGFRRVGVRRDAAMSRGAQVDVVLMDVVPADLA